jgi:hypothetical protein
MGLLTGSAFPQGGANINRTFLTGKIHRILQRTHILRCAPGRDAHILKYMLRFPVLARLVSKPF